jgi:hypothetical protein
MQFFCFLFTMSYNTVQMALEGVKLDNSVYLIHP